MAKILAIDNEPHILLLIKDKLEEHNHNVVTLRQTTNALEIVRREKPDLIILDWMMPEISGLELCKILKSNVDTHDIPVFILTGRGNLEDEQRGLRCGAEKYITKPFSPQLLLELVENSIEKRIS